MEFYDYEDFKNKIKDKCVICGYGIPVTWMRYLTYGNFCSICDNIAEVYRPDKESTGKVLRMLLKRKIKDGIIRQGE